MTAEKISDKSELLKETEKWLRIDEVKAEGTKARIQRQNFINSHEQQVLWQDGELTPELTSIDNK